VFFGVAVCTFLASFQCDVFILCRTLLYTLLSTSCIALPHGAQVPVENLIGKEGDGFKQTMANFNGERWGICTQVLSVILCLHIGTALYLQWQS
jgi:hypothetical protein